MRIALVVGSIGSAVAAGCGYEPASVFDASANDASGEAAPDASTADVPTPPLDRCPTPPGVIVGHFIPLPPPGVTAALAELCAASQTPVQSSGAARIFIGDYSPATQTAMGWASVPEEIHLATSAFPTVSVVSASDPALANVELSGTSGISTGFVFWLHWPKPLPQFGPSSLVLKMTMSVHCGDGGLQIIESIGNLEKCDAPLLHTWQSGGDWCGVCEFPQDIPAPRHP